ncbi:hypothetical protein RRU94_00415 [Domibacillus sp. DTU_2020_1001157_1_SI_ALB_TIR_016]|uniref:hypothetical protein n=1 Tax=Domibacillus sp. DTU_2020_1001157_1_SI_ALB_TIR_016 TaxID=3077789 RepID=UPI0028ED27EE|nr:hypothetical protein [Domibacillus sp. DTU_2020_1001157_1_SI_ALB_TIR_016]WNS78473.1 hypothetical protein RRU94_00415 [Domibacillus sp. DTU_2020_1001157_1_SI_ALB_TIR_016]
MSYKKTFIDLSKKAFKNELEEKFSKENAYNLISNYFNDISASLKDEKEVTGKTLKIKIEEKCWSIQLNQLSELSIRFYKDEIIAKVKPGFQWREEILKYEQGRFYDYSKDMELSEELLDIYLKEAFESTINQLAR